MDYDFEIDKQKPQAIEIELNGRDGAPGPQGPEGPAGSPGPEGPAGAPGHTPVKGKDYWTSEDKAEIVDEVTPVIDSVVAGKIVPIEERLDDVEGDAINLKIRVDSMDDDLTAVDDKVGIVEEKLYGVKTDIEQLASDVNDVKTWSIQAEEDIEAKQDKLTQEKNAGENIIIDANGRISATGGGSGDVTKAYVDEQNRLQDVETSLIKADLNELEPIVLSNTNRIDVLEKMSKGILYDFVTQTVEGIQNIPKGSHLADLQKLEGKSVVWNQLVKNGNFADKSIWQGLTNATLTNNEVALSVENSGIFIWQPIEIPTNHMVYVSTMAKSNVAITAFQSFGSSETFTRTDLTNNYVQMCNVVKHTSSSTSYNAFRVADNVSATVNIKNAILIDLTQMFGAGNEPTLEECKALFTEDYYPYNIGELQSVDLTKMTIRGKNILDFEEFLNYRNDIPSASTQYNTVEKISEDTYKIFGSTSAMKLGYIVDVVPNKTYRVWHDSSTVIDGNSRLGTVTVYDGLDNTTTALLNNASFSSKDSIKTFTPTSKKVLVLIAVTGGSGSGTGTMKCPMIAISDSVFDVEHYSPYHEPTEIPLAFVGKSAGTVRDELDLVNKKYIQRVGVVDLTGNWLLYEGDNPFWYEASNKLSDAKKNVVIKENFISEYPVREFIKYSINDQVRIYTSTTVAPTGLMYYELENPIITDVSEVIDSFEVEGNGSIEFDSSIPVRNTIEYLRYLNEV